MYSATMIGGSTVCMKHMTRALYLGSVVFSAVCCPSGLGGAGLAGGLRFTPLLAVLDELARLAELSGQHFPAVPLPFRSAVKV